MSRGILAMGKKIRELRSLLAEQVATCEKLMRENAEYKTENQMLREVNARLRKGWCVKED